MPETLKAAIAEKVPVEVQGLIKNALLERFAFSISDDKSKELHKLAGKLWEAKDILRKVTKDVNETVLDLASAMRFQ